MVAVALSRLRSYPYYERLTGDSIDWFVPESFLPLFFYKAALLMDEKKPRPQARAGSLQPLGTGGR